MAESNPATDIPKGESSLSTMYAKRLDGYLPTLQSNQARLFYLKALHGSWTERYRRFIDTNGASEPRNAVYGQPTAYDFANTIAEIELRMFANDKTLSPSIQPESSTTEAPAHV